MMPGFIEYYKCPNCKSFLTTMSCFSSYNTYDAKLYSDGFYYGPGIPSEPKISRCTNCKTIFWLNWRSHYVTKSFKELRNSPREENVYSAFHLDAEGYCSVIENKKLMKGKRKELYIRRNLLIRFNDRIRFEDYQFHLENESAIWNANIERLLKLLSYYDYEHLMLRAEIYRYLGKFDECVDILSKVKDQNYDLLKEALIKACQEKNIKVFIVKEN